MTQQPLVGQGFLIIENTRLHSDTPHSRTQDYTQTHHTRGHKITLRHTTLEDTRLHSDTPHSRTHDYTQTHHTRGHKITLRHTTLEVTRLHSDTPLSVGLLRTSDQPDGGDIYLTTHSTHYIHPSMSPAGFEPTIPRTERQDLALDPAATGTDNSGCYHSNFRT